MKRGGFFLVHPLLSEQIRIFILDRLVINNINYVVFYEKDEKLISRYQAFLTTTNKVNREKIYPLDANIFKFIKQQIVKIVNTKHFQRSHVLENAIGFDENNLAITIPAIYSHHFGEKIELINLECKEKIPPYDPLPSSSNVSIEMEDSNDSNVSAMEESDDEKSLEGELTDRDLDTWLEYKV